VKNKLREENSFGDKRKATVVGRGGISLLDIRILTIEGVPINGTVLPIEALSSAKIRVHGIRMRMGYTKERDHVLTNGGIK
jgi:hypothetical protein